MAFCTLYTYMSMASAACSFPASAAASTSRMSEPTPETPRMPLCLLSSSSISSKVLPSRRMM